MTTVTRLLLIRHCEPDEHALGRCYGSLDLGLSNLGLRNATRLASALEQVGVAAIYTSPALRARQTAASIVAARGVEPIVVEALRELDFGEFEGRTYEEIAQSHPEHYRQWMESPTEVRFPGGENYTQLQQRTLKAIASIQGRHAGQVAAVVTHGGVIRAILAHCLHIPDESIFRLDQSYGALNIIDWIDTVPLLRLLNGNLYRQQSSLIPSLDDPERRSSGHDRRFERPPLPPGFDDSRAQERARDPSAWRFPQPERDAVWRVIAERRDIRRFRPDPLPNGMLQRLLEAAHQAPSVGLMQPWRFVTVESEQTKTAMQTLAAHERLVQSEQFNQRTREFLDLKIEGIREAPINLCICCEREQREVLGRHTIRDTDLYSTCLAIENLWLAARAEGIGVGWVSFYQPDDVRDLLGLPAHVIPVAWLCIGYPDEHPTRPGLETAGWEKRRPLDQLVFNERWDRRPQNDVTEPEAIKASATKSQPLPEWWRRLADRVPPGDPAAAIAARDNSDQLVKPAGSLGALETLIERWATATGSPPPLNPRAGILVLAADHGVARHRVSLYPARVSSQVAAAAARGETAIGVLAHALGSELIVADLGLTGPKYGAVVDCRIADGTADIVPEGQQ